MPDKQTSSNSGYSQEDEYFKKQELELLAKRRAALDAQRQSAATTGTTHPHWMKCPKCGSTMSEVSMESVKIDRCDGCGGVYFDKGELELLTQGKQPAGFFKKLFG